MYVDWICVVNLKYICILWNYSKQIFLISLLAKQKLIKKTKCLAGSSWVGQCLLFKGLIKMLMGVPRLAKNTFIVACCCCFSFCSHICCLLYIVHAHVVTLVKFQSAHLAISVKCITGYSKSDWFLNQFYERQFSVNFFVSL